MWLSEMRVVLPDGTLENGSICIGDDGRIAEIIEGPAPRPDVVARGLIALPGLVDMHGDMIEREVEPRPKANIPLSIAIHELDKRLVGCGITTHYAAVSFEWERVDKKLLRTRDKAVEIIDAIHAEKEDLLCDMRVHSRFEISNPHVGEILIGLVEQGKIDLVSVMDHTPGQGQYRDIEKYIQFIQKYREQIKGESISEGTLREEIKRRQEQPKAWDVVQQVAEYVAEQGLILASHDDDTIEKVAMMADFGITISEFPVTAVAAEEAKRRGIHTAMGAPNALRGASLSGNLSAFDAVAQGICDTLATDYHPGSMIHAMFKFVREGVLSLSEASKVVSANPAHSVGLTDRGELAVGKRADIILADDEELPRVHGTLCAGQPVYWDRKMNQMSQQRFSAVV